MAFPQAAGYPAVSVIQQMAPTSRKNRRPKHTFQVRQKPWDIQPFVIAPVIPGETMQAALYQSRVVTDPIKNPLIGWWMEYYYFYVKLRDLDIKEDLVQLMLDPAANLTAHHSAAKVATYHLASSVDFVQLCLERIVKEYFRDEGEAYDAGGPGVIGGLPIAKAVGPRSSWLDSVELESVLAARTPNDLQNPHDGVDLDQYQQAYDRMRQARMIDMTFEDFLESFGVRIRQDQSQEGVPELLKYDRFWQYPSNTVEPTTGVPSSAVSWAISGRLDKDRFFREPGFIVGVSVARPKVYFSNQKGTASALLDEAENWLPALLGDQPWTSLKKVLGTGGPLAGLAGTPAGDYWVDLRDLFMYGDQFVNFATTETDAGFVALPKAGMNKHYVNAADRTALFASAKELVRQDGVIDFTIKGPPLTTVDHT